MSSDFEGTHKYQLHIPNQRDSTQNATSCLKKSINTPEIIL